MILRLCWTYWDTALKDAHGRNCRWHVCQAPVRADLFLQAAGSPIVSHPFDKFLLSPCSMWGSVLGAETAAQKQNNAQDPCAHYILEGTGRGQMINIISKSNRRLEGNVC